MWYYDTTTNIYKTSPENPLETVPGETKELGFAADNRHIYKDVILQKKDSKLLMS